MNIPIRGAIFLCSRVPIGSWQHLIPIGLASIFGYFFIKYAKYHLNKKQQEQFVHAFTCLISAVVILFHAHIMVYETYNLSTDLPLYLCSLLGLVMPIFTHYRRIWMYEILLFWIVGGTLQAVLTPDIALGFPCFDYFRYWIVHLGLLIIIFYATFVFEMRPHFKSIFKSFLALQVYVLIMLAVNFFLKSNYFYLNAKPESASLLDHFGDWPYYIIVIQLLVIPYFMVIYLPFYLAKRRRNN